MGEEPKQLEPGRALDRVIAEKMGFKYIPEGKGGWPEHIEFADQPGHFVELPDYSTQINDAWQLVEFVLAKGYDYEIGNYSQAEHYVKFSYHKVLALTVPHAICLAFLELEWKP